MLNRTILSLICILGLISCLTACNDKEAVKQKVQAIQVTTLKAEPTTQPYVAEVFGQTEGSGFLFVIFLAHCGGTVGSLGYMTGKDDAVAVGFGTVLWWNRAVCCRPAEGTGGDDADRG